MAFDELECLPMALGIPIRSYGRLRPISTASRICPRRWPKRSRKPPSIKANGVASALAVLLLELGIDLDLVPGHHFVRFIRHADDRHQLFEHCVGHTLLLG